MSQRRDSRLPRSEQNCEFNLCVYNLNNKCLVEIIKINFSVMCKDCDKVLFDSKAVEILESKKSQLCWEKLPAL